MALGQRLFPIFIAAALLVLSAPWRVEATGWSATFGTAAVGERVDSVSPTADGSYLVSSELGKHLTKVSAAGEVIWSREMLFGALREQLVPAGDGFLVLGYKTLARLNGLGEVVWWRSLDSLSPAIARAWPDGTLLIGADQEIGDQPFIAKLTSSGLVLWQISVILPALPEGTSELYDFLPLRDGSFLALMAVGNIDQSATYVVRFSNIGTVIWARALKGGASVLSLGETAGGGYFAYGFGVLITLDSNGNVMGFRAGLPASRHGIRPTVDGGYIAVGDDGGFLQIAEIQKLDRQLNSEWVRNFESPGTTLDLYSITPAPADGWIVGGAIIPPGQSHYDGWIFRLASGGQPFGNCPASVLAEPDLGNGSRQCEVQLSYPSSPPFIPIASVTRCDLPAAPPGFSPVRQDFDFECGPGALPNAVQCSVTTRNNYSGNFYLSQGFVVDSVHVGPNASATFAYTFLPDTPPGTYYIEALTRGTSIFSAPAAVSTQPGPALTSIQTPISWLPHSLSRNLLCSGEPEVCPLASALDGKPELDSDGDSLPDCIELHGVRDPNSGQMLVDLPALGANPNHKDVFVEIDYLEGANHCHRPDPKAIAHAEQALAELGINLHVDYGQREWGTLSESDVHKGRPATPGINYDDTPLSVSVLEELEDTQVEPRRMGFSEKRRGIFHYCIFGHIVDAANFSVAGNSPMIPGADFVVGWISLLGIQKQAATFIHELGHNLGLEHGGKDKLNGKPNYRSVMNYDFATTAALLRFSTVVLPPLDEACLDERAGIGTAKFTYYHCPPEVTSYIRRVEDGHEIDWDCSGPPLQPSVRANINGDRQRIKPCGSDENTLLKGFEDAKLVDFSGIRLHAPGPADAAETVPDPEPPEFTVEQVIATPKPEKLVVEAVSPMVSLAWGETRQVSFRVSNLGVEDDTYDLFAYSTAGYALGGAQGPLTPAPIALGGGDSTLVEIAITAPATGVPGVSDLALIVTGRRRPELAEEVTVQIVAGSSEPLGFYILPPCRVADTRPASALASDLVRNFPVGSRCGVPPSARAVAANVTVTQAAGYGNVTLFPSGQALATTSTINFGPGQVRSNNAILQLGSDAGLAAVPFVAGGGGVHLIIDVTGYFE